MVDLLAHFPKKKQEELKEILNFICQHPEVGLVILFGSYARGDWVEEYEKMVSISNTKVILIC